jgi:phospholipid/cholesterol/gamma-HCH transport system substrate-binding protein
MESYARGRDAIRVGLVAVTAVAAFITLFGFATGHALGERRTTLYMRFPVAEGLQRGDAVLLYGVTVGQVRELSFGSERASGSVLVRARLDRPVPLGTDASADLVAADIFGRKSIALRPGISGGGLEDGDTLTGAAAGSLTATMEALGARVQRLVGDSTVNLLHGTLADAAHAASGLGTLALTTNQAIDEQRSRLSAALDEMTRLAANLGDLTAPEGAEPIRARADTVMIRLTQSSARLDSATVTLNAVMFQLQQGDGTASLLLHDARLYESAVSSLASLDALLRDVRSDPKRYISIKLF